MPSTSRNDSILSLKKSKAYYFEPGDLHIIVEETRFRVHSYFFARDSPVFHKLLNPASPGDNKHGSSESDAMMLADVSVQDFETFLWVFYNPRYSLYDAPVETWHTILRLADKWDFKQVKELAVREPNKKKDLALIDRMALYQAYKVDNKHLVPLYAELVKRDRPLSIEEARVLGLETMVLVNTAREKLRANPSNGGLSPLPEGLEDGDVHREIEGLLDGDMGREIQLSAYPHDDRSRPASPVRAPSFRVPSGFADSLCFTNTTGYHKPTKLDTRTSTLTRGKHSPSRKNGSHLRRPPSSSD